MKDFLVAIIAGGVGLMLLALGYRFARILIPLWGFITGISLGGAVISAMNETPFLGTVLGISIGVLLGLAFAILAYLFYSVAVVILVGSFGYWLGSSFILLFGLNPGVLSVLAGLALGVVFGVIAVLGNAPKYFLIVATALSGAVVTIGAILLMFNQIQLSAYSYAAARVVIANSFLWTVAAIALAVIGMFVQVQTTDDYSLEEWGMDHDNMTPTTPVAPRPAAM